ncbi:hypothetical protein [Nonomuraea sp. NPDC049400]|uniref:hypothetical protein n=1 Tax=Nonomuraea sp. NPDC049400 TaxID=3364352 RepID=UPI00378E8DC4
MRTIGMVAGFYAAPHRDYGADLGPATRQPLDRLGHDPPLEHHRAQQGRGRIALPSTELGAAPMAEVVALTSLLGLGDSGR